MLRCYKCPYFDSNLLKVKGQRVCDMEVERGRQALYQGTGFSRLKPCRYTSVAKGFSRWDSLGAQGLKPKPFSRFFGTAEAVPDTKPLERARPCIHLTFRFKFTGMENFGISASRTGWSTCASNGPPRDALE